MITIWGIMIAEKKGTGTFFSKKSPSKHKQTADMQIAAACIAL
jgi:hypothetical protein